MCACARQNKRKHGITDDDKTLEWDASSGSAKKRIWRRFGEKERDDIDAAYRSFKIGEGSSAVTVRVGESTYQLNFKTMVQRNLDTG